MNATWYRCLAPLVLAFFAAAADAEQYVEFDPSLLVPSDDCRGISAAESESQLRIGYLGPYPGMIAPPRPDQDYQQWLTALTDYREAVKRHPAATQFQLDFQGVRGWLRLDEPLARRLTFQSGERTDWQFEVLSVEGNNELCLALDLHDTGDNHKTGWSTVLSSVEIPQDGQWHTVTVQLDMPTFNPETTWVRPIFGMDGTHNPRPGRMYLRRVALRSSDERNRAIAQAASPSQPLDMSLYDRTDLQWLATSFACHFTFMYDLSFFDPQSGRFLVDQFLADGEREFGGYDAVLLWHAYPRIGVDQRNQFDFYRDMPGGLDGMRQLVHDLQQHGVKVYINYNPWDLATRREPVSTLQSLADIVAAMDVDGIFLDTMAAGSQELRTLVDQQRTGVAFVPEIFPSVADLSSLMGSWYQFGVNPFAEPSLLHHKWIEPRHMELQISRWKGLHPHEQDPHHQEIENAFFNGSGMMIWENIFGAYNPWRVRDRMLWSRAVRVLRTYQEYFVAGSWQPFYPTDQPELFAHRWTHDGQALFTLVNHGEERSDAPLLTLSGLDSSAQAFDLWQGRELQLRHLPDGRRQVIGSIGRLGGILVTSRTDDRLKRLMQRQQQDAWRGEPQVDLRNVVDSVVYPQPVCRTSPTTGRQASAGMVYVPGGMLTMHIQHARREPGCHPDPTTDPRDWVKYNEWNWSEPLHHNVGPVQVHPFWIDEAEVTNAEFDEFLRATGYQPACRVNFLQHWPEGIMPPQLADHPVVYVDLDDARAYARWAGKRLPTEEEWHLAAQGLDGRKWPWGNEEPTTERVNLSGDHTMGARTCPNGRSPFGCYHMSGNVYEWTESYRNDRHTRYVMIRGGSYFDPKADPATASLWYTDGGPQPCEHHAKFILMYPGLDRCATIGFRCVRDVHSRSAVDPARPRENDE